MKRSLAAIAILSLTAGCTVTRQELRHSGGFAGQVMDRHLFDATPSKRLQLLRMTMIVALASRIGNSTIRDGDEADTFINYVRNATNEINYLAGHLYGQRSYLDGEGGRQLRYTCTELNRPVVPAPLPANSAEQQCDTYEALFESDLPQLENKATRLVMAALPRDQAAQFARAIRSGNVMAAAWRFLQLAGAAADGMHRGAAVYRSEQEILAITIAANHEKGGECANHASAANIRTVEAAIACLGLSNDSLTHNPMEARVRFPTDVQTDSFEALFEIIRTSCLMLPIDVDAGNNSQGLTGAGRIQARLDACRSLQFRPTLRFGGRRGLISPPPPAPPQP